MTKRTIDLITLATAILGAATGMIALAWQMVDARRAEAEYLSVSGSPVLLFDEQPKVGFFVTITNHSRDPVYLSRVAVEFDGEERVSSDSLVFYPLFLPQEGFDVHLPLQPRESRFVELRPRPEHVSSCSDWLRRYGSRVVVDTTMGSRFVLEGYSDQLHATLDGYDKALKMRALLRP